MVLVMWNQRYCCMQYTKRSESMYMSVYKCHVQYEYGSKREWFRWLSSAAPPTRVTSFGYRWDATKVPRSSQAINQSTILNWIERSQPDEQPSWERIVDINCWNYCESFDSRPDIKYVSGWIETNVCLRWARLNWCTARTRYIYTL